MKMFPNIKILERKYTFLNKSKKNLSFLSSAVHHENKRDKVVYVYIAISQDTCTVLECLHSLMIIHI